MHLGLGIRVSDFELRFKNINCFDFQNGICANVEGGFQCTCNEGFTLSGMGDSCIDIDECTVIPNTCGNGTCINSFGSYRCRCNYGFQMNAENSCEDIDECRSRYNICRNGRCKNTKGMSKLKILQ